LFLAIGASPVLGNPAFLGVVLDVLGVVLATAQVGTILIVSVVVETVPPKDNALPVQVIVLPIVVPEASMSVPWNIEFAPNVVAAPGVHQTSQAVAPFDSVMIELADVFRAPVILKMYVPLPLRVIVPPPPIVAAPEIQ
jgi:hypothetical protein